jgi:hypothetical protein
MNINGGTATLGPVSLTASSASGTLNLSGNAVVTVPSIADTGTSTLDVNGATLNLDLQGFGNPATAPVSVDVFNTSGTVNLGVKGTGFTVGQFPLIHYTGSIGGSGFAALNLASLPAGVSATLVDNAGTQSVDLNVTAAPPAGPNPYPTNITTRVIGNQLSLSWPASHLGWELQSNSVSLVSSASWFLVPGSTGVTNLVLTIHPGLTNIFYRMHLP